jgi:hypothetical protein
MMGRIGVAIACSCCLTACDDQAGRSSPPASSSVDNGTYDLALEAAATYFVPEDASNVLTAYEFFWTPKSFEARPPFLQFAIGIDRLEKARADGWTLCQPISRNGKVTTMQPGRRCDSSDEHFTYYTKMMFWLR